MTPQPGQRGGSAKSMIGRTSLSRRTACTVPESCIPALSDSPRGGTSPRMDDMPFDRRLRRVRRDRAAAAPDDDRYLLRHAANELVERLASVKRDFVDVLDLGCGDGYLASVLRGHGMKVVEADAGELFSSRGVQCDEDRLPFADGSFDLVISAGALDSVNDLPGALTLVRRALRPDGLFLAAIGGAGSLPRLRRAMMAAEGGGASPRIHPQIDVRAAGDLLSRAGMTLPVVDGERMTVRFSNLLRLVHDLRAMGATNILRSRSSVPIGKAGLAAAWSDFAGDADPDGKTPEIFELLYLTAWAPSPDQPRPARRGSGSKSLADALRPGTNGSPPPATG